MRLVEPAYETVYEPVYEPAYEADSSGVLAPRGLASARAAPWAGRLGVTGVLAAGLLVSLSAAHTTLLLPDSVQLAFPRSMASPLGRAGPNLGLVGLIVVLGGMFGSYIVADRARSRLSGRAVVMSIAALIALLLLAPPVMSTDVFSYGAYARMGAVYGINPYLHGPGAIQLDPWYSLVGSQWVGTPSVYGPLFTLLSYPLAGLSIAASVLAYKALAAACAVFVVVAVWNCARLRGLNPVGAVILVGLNPVLLVYGVGGGHNDMLMLALLVGGLWALLARHRRCSGALMAAATAVKLTAAILVPFALLAREARGEVGRRSPFSRPWLLGAVLAAVAVAAASFVVFGGGPLRLLGTLQTIQGHGGPQSIPGFIAAALGLGRLGTAPTAVLDAGFVVAVAWLLVRVHAGRMDWIAGAGWAVVALLVTTSFLLPWYTTWLLPLAALSGDRRLRYVTIFLAAVGLTTL